MRAPSLFVFTLLAGCVGSDPTPASGPSATDTFLGTWKTTTGTQTLTGCALAQTNKNVAVTMTVTKGGAGDIVMTNTLAPTCSLHADVSGTEARLAAGQTCISPTKDSYTYATTSTFAITAQSSNEGIVKLDATVTFANGMVCTFSESDPYAKE
jgi:hypothetical protein